jgi:hypothetical protein
MDLAFPTFSLQALASMALDHRDVDRVPGILRPHVVLTLQALRRRRLRRRVLPTDRFTVTGCEKSTKSYGKRKVVEISRSDVSFSEFFDDDGDSNMYEHLEFRPTAACTSGSR